MTEPGSMEGGDFVRVASCETPTEAHLLRGVLEANGLTPRVADANFVQADSWMTQAVGGVRVLVPAEQVPAARHAIAEFHAGAFQLEGEDATPAKKPEAQGAPLFSLDRATLLSFVLTPAFGAAIQIANASALGTTAHRLRNWLWLVALVAVSVFGVCVVHQLNPGPFVVFRASLLMSFVTIVWYVAVGRVQARHLIATYGRKYRQRSVAVPSLAAAAAMLALGWSLAEFA